MTMNKDEVAKQVDEAGGGWVPPPLGLDARDFTATLKAVLGAPLRHPQTFVKHQAAFAGEVIKALTGASELKPAKGDKRFSDPAWTQHPAYRVLMQTYLGWTNYWHDVLDDLDIHGIDRERARFVISLLVDAVSPSNSHINPLAVKRMLETGGASVVHGIENLLSDMVHNGGMPSMVDKSAFKVGENIANTEGAVVFRNEVLELIQYKPLAKKVRQRPFFMVPPMVNKYYVMDVSAEKSMVRYLLQQGQQVFIISWRNPTAEQSDWGFDTYINAAREALDVALAISKSKDCNLWAGCAGGIVSSIMLSMMATEKKRLVNSLSLNVCILYLPTDSQMGMMITGTTMKKSRERTEKHGVLDGKSMANMFAWLRPNDLVWNYWVNNYLMGEKPPAFDLLYWNCDNTRLAGRFHRELMQLIANKWLAHPGEMKVGGVPIDLKQVDCDVFALGGDTDHITPWRDCYESTHFLGGKCDFILSNSGHIQAMLNPPGNKKSSYFTNPARPADADKWLEGATQQSGTWWEWWIKWLNERGGDLVDAPTALGNKTHLALYPAPGKYVLEP